MLYGLRDPEMQGGPLGGERALQLVPESIPGENLVNRIAVRMKTWFDEL